MKYTFAQIKDDINAVKELYPNIDDNKFYELLKLDPTYRDGSNSVGTYGKWILNLYKKGNLKEEDFYKVSDYLKDFEAKKKNIANKDINSYKTLPELAKVLEETETPEQSKNQLRKAVQRTNLNEDAEYIGDFGKYVCYSPKTYEASCKLGANTEWCTATREDRAYYDRYSGKGKLYIFIDKSTNQAEYQLHFETESFMDRYDDEISLETFVNEICQEARAFIVKIIKELIKNKKANSLKYIWLDEILKDYEEIIKKALRVKDGYLSPTIYFDNLATEFSNNGSTDLNESFIEDVLKGDLYYYFDVNYDDVDIDEYEEYVNDKNKKQLKEYHLKYENIRDLNVLISDAINSGNANQCIEDVEYEIEEAFKSIGCISSFNEYDENSFKVVMKYDDYIKLLKQSYNDEYFMNDLGYDYGDDPDDVILYWASQKFRLYEPRYGWQGEFDEDRFNDEISEWLDYVTLFEINEDYQPKFDDEEDYKKWAHWFKTNILDEDDIAEGQQQMNLDSAKYVFIKTKE